MRFSIIIPTHNRPALLDRCLEAVGSLAHPKTEFEVLVVDDGSDPPPEDVIARHRSRLPLRYIRHENQGPARSRNRALRLAQGDYVVFTDDDCEPQRDWLTALEKAFAERPHGCIGGRIECAAENGLCGIASQLLVTFLYEYASAQNGSGAAGLKFFCSNNVAFPREALLRIGGFDETFPLAAAEDRELCARWLELGDLHFAPAAVVRHRQDLNLKSFYSQHHRYGRGAFQFWLRRSAEGRAGNRPQPFSFYWKMLAYPFTKVAFPRALAVSLLLVVSQIACVAGYFAERAKYAKCRRGIELGTQGEPPQPLRPA
jgi:cellulose synthase/poly-beta-1,6-N-acetylglucosamine synthase-like glycosyltransferase